jgi:two-component system chemotaxis sensor kinase CheA
MLFDEVAGSENIVVKPLPPLLRPLGLYAATTILGDGSVALILSAEGVARHGGVFDKAVADTVEALPDDGRRVAHDETRAGPVLLFRYGRNELLAARMDAVRRVVMIAPDRISRIGEREMVNVDGTATNVIRLDHFLSISGCAEVNRLYLLLPRNLDTRVGVLVSEIVDTPTLPLQPDPRGYRADGVLGTMMIRGQVALLVDLERVVQMWERVNGEGRAPALPGRPARRVLVVDDTAFFQKLVAEYLRGAGYEVTVAGDGGAGLTTLREGTFDLVVCDIEMPVMDGHAFARAVRAGDPSIARTPLLALTTLNTPESRGAAAVSGFDAYEVKLDANTLLASVARLLERSTARPAVLTGAHADA